MLLALLTPFSRRQRRGSRATYLPAAPEKIQKEKENENAKAIRERQQSEQQHRTA
jgi:hypothetical protein